MSGSRLDRYVETEEAIQKSCLVQRNRAAGLQVIA